MSNLDLISAYLEDRMSAEERQNFEAALSNDPELNREFEFQKDIVEGIKYARRSELKAMMDNVPVGGGAGMGGTISFGKLATGIAIVGGISLGAYYFFAGEEQIEKPEPTTTESISVEPEEEFIDAEEERVTEEPVKEEINEVAKTENKPAVTKDVTEDPKEEVQSAPDIKTPSSPVFETPDADSLEAPPNKLVEKAENNVATMDVEIDKTNKKYDFHYQIKDGKLHLYGDFDKALYEILEFTSQEEKSLFLYYNERFYPLDKDQEKITALQPVNESSLVEKLKKLISTE